MEGMVGEKGLLPERSEWFRSRANIGSAQGKRRQTGNRGAVTIVWLCTLWCIVTLVCSLPATLRAAEAQPRAKVPRIGFLGSSSPAPYEPIIDALRQGMRELGWVEGHNVTIEFRWAEGELERLQALGVELHPVAFRHPQDFEAGFAAMRQGGADALLVMGHPMTFNAAPHLAELAVRGRLPAIALYREFAQAGGLMAYGASIAHLC